MSQITVISGPERRRVWSDEQKRELVAAVSAPGANVVSAFIGTAFAQETAEAASQQWRSVADQMRPKLP